MAVAPKELVNQLENSPENPEKNKNKKKSDSFSSSAIVKIWFSKPNADHPLGHEINVVRLEQHRKNFPDDTINLVSNYRDFSEENISLLKSICARLQINLIDFYSIGEQIENSDIKDKEEQLRLFKFAKEEIAQRVVSCFAVASDITRTLSPISKLGIYYDLDDIKLISPPDLSFGLRLAAKIGGDEQKFHVEMCNNTPLMCNESKNTFLAGYRKEILSRYEVQNLASLYVEMYNYGVFCDPSNKNETSVRKTLPIINKIKQRVSEVIKDKELSKWYSFPLLIRQIISEVIPNKSKSENAIKAMIVLCSGPNCMQMTLQKYLDTDFSAHCRREQMNITQKVELLQSMVLLTKYHQHQNDVAWLPSQDTTQQNSLTYYNLTSQRAAEADKKKDNDVAEDAEPDVASKTKKVDLSKDGH